MSSSKLISPSPFSSMASTSIAASSGGTSMTSTIAPIASQSLAWLSGSVRSIEWSDGPVLTSELREESYSKLSLLIHEKTSKVTMAIVSQSHASEQPGRKAGQVSAATSLEMGHADASPQ